MFEDCNLLFPVRQLPLHPLAFMNLDTEITLYDLATVLVIYFITYFLIIMSKNIEILRLRNYSLAFSFISLEVYLFFLVILIMTISAEFGCGVSGLGYLYTELQDTLV